MLCEVASESPFDAGRPLVRGDFLDIRRSDTGNLIVLDVQIDLASDATVGAHRPHHVVGTHPRLPETISGHDLEDCTGWADANTFPAPCACSLVGVTVASHHDLGSLATVSDIEHSDDLNVLACTHASRTQNTGAHIVPDHRVARSLIALTQRKVTARDRCRLDTILHQILFELVLRSGRPTVTEVICRIPLSEK
jgi:hypothetical protein